MKATLLLLPLLLSFAGGNPDYANEAGFSASTCAEPPESGAYQSPIVIGADVPCQAYQSFNLKLNNIDSTYKADNRTGSVRYDFPNNSNNRLEFGSKTFIVDSLLIRHQAEHYLYSTHERPNLELQFIMHTPNNENGVMSFLVHSTSKNGEIESGRDQAFNKFKIVEALGDGKVKMNLKTLASHINQKASKDSHLNFYTYPGTLTYPPCGEADWFVYGGVLHIEQSQLEAFINDPEFKSLPLASGSSNARPLGGSNIASHNGAKGQTDKIQRLCYTGDYFTNTIGQNSALWFAVASIILFFLFTLVMGDKPIKDPDYVEDAWTHHPIISIVKYGNEIHTRKTRAALILATVDVHAVFTAIWYAQSDPANRDRSSNLIVYAVYSMLCSWFITFIVGVMLRGYYLAKREYCKGKDEEWDQKAQNRIFAYYFSVFLITVVGWPITVWQLTTLAGDDKMWIATLFIGLALEFIIVDPFVCLLASFSGTIRSLIRKKGYLYDDVCHETFMDYMKFE